jgi:OFA family oxalate/formate antiporter-like MFS transporter
MTSQGSEEGVVGRSGPGRLDRALIVLAAFLGIGVGFPSVYSSTATVFILPLSETFGWGRSIPSLMYLAGTGGMAIASLWLGRVIAAWGAPRVAALSGLCLAIVLALLGRQSGAPAEAMLLCFIGGALGVGTGAGLWLSIPPGWFDAHLGRALGVVAIGQSFGMALLPPLATSVILAHGWRQAYWVLAGVSLATTLVAAGLLYLIYRRNGVVRGTAPNIALDGLMLAEAIRTRRFWLIALMTFLICFGVVGASIHLFPLFVDRGVEPARLPMAALALGVGTVIGRSCSGVALDQWEARNVAIILFALGAAGLTWMMVMPGDITLLHLVAPPLLIGMALGAESDLLAFLSRRAFGMRDLPVIYNRLLIAFYLGAVSGTMAVGMLSDLGYDRNTGVALLFASCLAAAILSRFLPTSRGESAY